VEIVVIDEATKIDWRDVQLSNTDSPRDLILHRDSNPTADRSQQLEKQDFAIVSSEEGRQIDRSDEQYENEDSPSTTILHPGANVTIERFSQ
jgi:hypothetical protein